MVTHDEVRKIAALAKLYIPEAQLDEMTNDLNGILAFAGAISEADTSGYDADDAVAKALPLRADVSVFSYAPEMILANAMEAGDGFFIVRDRTLYE